MGIAGTSRYVLAIILPASFLLLSSFLFLSSFQFLNHISPNSIPNFTYSYYLPKIEKQR